MIFSVAMALFDSFEDILSSQLLGAFVDQITAFVWVSALCSD
jgi:hypothetical protein